jgi:hypothetical protein
MASFLHYLGGAILEEYGVEYTRDEDAAKELRWTCFKYDLVRLPDGKRIERKCYCKSADGMYKLLQYWNHSSDWVCVPMWRHVR